MPTTINAVITNALQQSLTGPSDGETADAGDVNAPFQKLLDNTNKTSRYVLADFTALRALTTMVANERYFVVGYGWYEWQSGSAAPEDVPWVIDPTVGGAGRFHSMVDILRNTGGQGLASTDSSNLTIQYPHLGVVAQAAYQNASGGSIGTGTSSTTFVDVDGGSVNIALAGLLAGDVIDTSTHFRMRDSTGAHLAGVQLVRRENVAAYAPSLTTLWDVFVATSVETYAVKSRYIMTAPGTFDAKLQFRISNVAGNAQLLGPGAMFAYAWRP